MTAFDRNAALEQQQIREISDNVTRRLLKALERCRALPPALASEVGASARTVSEIQREIDHLIASWPPHDPLDIAVLTHVLSSQQHALGLLEDLEAKLQSAHPVLPRPAYDAAHTHQALLAVSRNIEAEAMGHRPPSAAPSHVAQQAPPPAWAPPPAHAPPRGYAAPPAAFGPATAWPAPSATPVHATGQPPPREPPQARTHTAQHPARATPPTAATAAGSALASLRTALSGPSTVATLTALTVATVLIAGVMSLMPPPNSQRAGRTADLAPGQKLDGRLDAGESASAKRDETKRDEIMSTFPVLGLAGGGAASAMEPPYLVVLATRRSTDELQRDYQALKTAYPDLLGTSKARVDRVQGQDRQTWYRLSLVPPQAHADAKALCRSLKAAGLAGCWIRQVPLD